MSYDGIYATLVEVQYKAGLTASATSIAEGYVNSFIFQAESYINVATRKIWATTTALFASGLAAGVRGILTEAASNLAAIYCIEYDMSGATQTTLERIDSEDKINVLYRRAMDCIKLLQEEDSKHFMGA